MYGGGVTVADYQNSKILPLEYLAKHVALQDASATGVYLKNTHQMQQVKNLKYSNWFFEFIK